MRSNLRIQIGFYEVTESCLFKAPNRFYIFLFVIVVNSGELMAEENTRGVVSDFKDDNTDDLFVEFMVSENGETVETGDVTLDPVDPVGGGDGSCGSGGSGGDGGGDGGGGGDGEGDGGDGDGDGDGNGEAIWNDDGVECPYCGSIGHIEEDCYWMRRMDGGRGCYYCGDPGHLVSECDKEYRIVGDLVFCLSCGMVGHIASHCTLIEPAAASFAPANQLNCEPGLP